MYTTLLIDGTPADHQDEGPERVTVEFDGTDTPFRCRACGDDLQSTPDGFADTSGERACGASDSDDNTAHEPERTPLSWCNNASVSVDEDEDSITLAISVGDPRGAFTFTIRRVPDDADGPLAGRLIMHTPYPTEPLPHEKLTPLHPGTHLIGHAESRSCPVSPTT